LAQLVHLAECGGRSAPQEADPWTHQLLAAELRLTLVAQFPEIEACRELAEAGYKSLLRVLDQTRVGAGLPPCEYLNSLRPLSASWTRCRLLSQQVDSGQSNGQMHWPAEANPLLRQVLWQTLRLMRRDGSPTMSKPASKYDDEKLFEAA